MNADPSPAEARAPILPREDARGLRVWFVSYVFWLTALCCLAMWAQERHAAGVAGAQRIWLGSVYVFYLSLCCTFFPLPTAWIVMLLATRDAALVEAVVWRVLAVATLGALATCLANLNEYHIWMCLLRSRHLARVRGTRLFRWARAKFEVAPFAVLIAFSFIPIPVDVVRWLAVACRYSRSRFFLAYFVGRWVRYGLLAWGTVWLELDWWPILWAQAGLVLLAAARFAVAYRARGTARPDAVPGSVARHSGRS